MPRTARARSRSKSSTPAPAVTLDSAFAAVQQLVEHFREYESDFLSQNYQEVEARRDFIDKFLIALGWDVNHDYQRNPYQQEVKVERGVNTHGSQRRADYAFHVAPNFQDVRFFVEAKKPFGDLTSPDNCFQAIRYGWSAQTPVVVLTNFFQFAILDSRYMPDIDTATTRVVKKFHYSDYANAEEFAKIYYLFSRESVPAGSLEQYAATLPKRRGKAVQLGLFKGGYQSIDESFLLVLDEYRERLARNFKRKNPELDGEVLTEITQRVIDRLVFIRFLEDKMIQPQHLISQFGDKGTAWQDFVAASRKLDAFCNGVVFKRHSIIDSSSLKVDDRDFADICEKLADINSPYDFNAIPIHILGSIYERFLGKVITTTAKRATVEEKPEVRKAGGVYYTPEYIVRYIVENTVGKLIEGKTPAQIAEMRFADIACGSGSFLLGVFDLLLRYHGEWYNARPSQAKKDGCELRDDGIWHLSLAQRRQILVNNIYGVDIDRQAVEVAQLSLYLKLLEDETTATARAYQLEMHETLLPRLDENIVCGNALIENDILDGYLFEPIEEKKLNPMTFKSRFPAIIKDGGFNVVLGNPPWISLSGKFGNDFLPATALSYLISKYTGNTYMPNMYEYFVARGLSLTKQGGLFSFIVPDRLGFNAQFSHLRERIFNESEILSLRYRIPFPGIVADTLVFVLRKGSVSASHEVNISEYGQDCIVKKQITMGTPPEWKFDYRIDIQSQEVLDKIHSLENVAPLAEFASCTSGFGGKSSMITESRLNRSQIETLKGDSISRYQMRKVYYFEFKRANITGRTTNTDKLGATQKVLIRKTGNSIVATFDESGIFPEQSLYFLYNGTSPLGFKYLLGLINSRLMNWVFKKTCLTNAQSIAQVKTVDLVRLPIRSLDLTVTDENILHARMVRLVDQMLEAQKMLLVCRSEGDCDFYTNKCRTLAAR